MARTFLLLPLLLLDLGILSPYALPAREQEFPEYQLKAAFVFNFARFVTWPALSHTNPFVIGVLGEDPFGPYLEQAIAGKKVNEKVLALKRLKNVEEAVASECQLLFISRSEKERFPAILSALGNKSILTVSEIGNFAQRGGMINFVIVEGSVRFEINLQAAERAGLQLSSKLCNLGIVVKPAPGKEAR